LHRKHVPTFDDTLAEAKTTAAAGQFRESDRVLARYAVEHPEDPAGADALYWRAVLNLEPSNQSRSVDTAIAQLDAYLASPKPLRHLDEAMALRDLAADTQELAKVQTALRQARSAGTDQSGGEGRGGEEAAKEIQRLRDELAAANAELERIKKRLANPKPQ
jgi:hypothetical protein